MPSITKKPHKNRVRVWILIALGLLVYSGFSYWFVTSFLFQKGTFSTPPFSKTARVTPTPTPSPRPIPSGKKTFSVSSGKKTGPQFASGAIDPYDPKIGSTQTISVTIVSSKPVTSGTLTMQTDTKTKKVPLSMVSGTPINGVWAGTWTVDDTYLYTYLATLTATDGTETNKVELTLR
jgi:hypothetical protein